MKKLYVAGHRGLVGSAIYREFSTGGGYEVVARTHAELDLEDRAATRAFFEAERPDRVILVAAKVGGIKANWDFPVDFLLRNLKIQNNVIEAAADFGVEKLLFLGSSCIYPKFAPQPIPESALLTGPLEPTNEAYALAKIAGIKLCQAYARQWGKRFLSGMPCNMYGPGDNFHPEHSHVLPALIRRAHEAKAAGADRMVLWGTGTPLREFLHSADLARACRVLMESYDSPEVINIGSGVEVTIREAAEAVCEAVGFTGKLEFDASKPDGTPRKLMDSSRMFALGWKPEVALVDGLREAYAWFLEHVAR